LTSTFSAALTLGVDSAAVMPDWNWVKLVECWMIERNVLSNCRATVTADFTLAEAPLIKLANFFSAFASLSNVPRSAFCMDDHLPDAISLPSAVDPLVCCFTSAV